MNYIDRGMWFKKNQGGGGDHHVSPPPQIRHCGDVPSQLSGIQILCLYESLLVQRSAHSDTSFDDFWFQKWFSYDCPWFQASNVFVTRMTINDFFFFINSLSIIWNSTIILILVWSQYFLRRSMGVNTRFVYLMCAIFSFSHTDTRFKILTSNA